MSKLKKTFINFIQQDVFKFVSALAKTLWVGLKFCGKFVYRLSSLIALVIVLVVPFLANIMSPVAAQWHWYPACALLLLQLIAERCFIQKDITQMSAIDRFGKAGEVLFLPASFCVFAFNFYTAQIAHWITFIAIALAFPLFFALLIIYDDKYMQYDTKEKGIAIANICKYVLIIWLSDLLYMSIFNGWQTLIYVFGIIVIVILFCGLSAAFLSEIRIMRAFLPFELLLGIGLIIYLIHIIPDEGLRNVILNISSSVLAGLIALVGVAWTIRHTNAARLEDLSRLETERREEERKKHIPYIRISFENELSPIVVNAHITKGMDFSNPDDRKLIDGKVYFSVNVHDFNIKNVSNANIILKGVVLHQKFYAFSQEEIVEPGAICRVKTTNNYWIAMPKVETAISLVIDDILGNTYEVNCPVSYSRDSMRLKTAFTVDGSEYIGYDYEYVVSSAQLPVLTDREAKNKPGE